MMQSKPHPTGHATDAQRDQALRDTFPASDAVPPGSPTPAPQPAPPSDPIQDDLDESLDESFPASDPPALSDPDHPPRKP